jgi:phosphatidate cytidylyltransferase
MDQFRLDKERWVVGLSLLAAVLLIWYVDSFFLTWFVLGAVYLLAFKEANDLFGLKSDSMFFYAALVWIAAYFYPYGDDLFVLVGVIFFGAVAYTQKIPWRDFLPFLYPTAGMLFFLTLYQEYNMTALAWLVVIVGLTDTGAYFVGKNFGKRKFCETSPNKTIEGVIGGVVIATVISFAIGVGIVGVPRAIIISFFVALASVFGDLFESYLKRRAGVKDSGSLLPGHGGVLDRIDGHLFGSIVMLVLLRGLV